MLLKSDATVYIYVYIKQMNIYKTSYFFNDLQ